MTQPFLETTRFPDDLAFWAQGGVNYNTVVVQSTSGREKRTSLWQYGRGQWDLQNVDRANVFPAQYSVQTLRNFFRVCKGQAYGFRFRDFTDYLDEGAGLLGLPIPNFGAVDVPTGLGGGVPMYQMFKAYILTPLADYRVIQKPYPTGVNILRNGAVVSTGSAPGDISLDSTTGLVTFVADAQASIASITPGGSTVLNLAAALTGAAAGKLIYLNGVGGDTLDVLNDLPLTITSVSGTAVTVSAATTGTTPTGGTAYMYPQASDALTWTGMFDTPCRFATDAFAPNFDAEGLWTFQTLAVVEIRL